MCNMKRRNRCIMMFVEMRLVWLWVMLVLASECYGCLEQERIALLQLKASINHPNGYSLPTWKDAWEGETTANCCEWERVQCNTTTGRVIQLSLNSTRNSLVSGDWYLNASMFLAFEELESLDLSENLLVHWLENEGFEKLAKLNNLQVLDLSYNGFNNSILSTLGGLRSLKSLNLGHNSLKGTFNIDDLRNLNNLMELDISYNFELDSFITHSGFERLSVLGKLEVLNLEWNSFNNSILPSLATLSSLKTLNLGGNYLNGSIDIGEFCNMSNLEELDLSYNGIYPNRIDDVKGFERLSILGKLEVLNLDGNSLNNNILPSLAVLSSLKTLNLGSNNLSGSIDIGEFCNMSNLKELDLSYNGIYPSSIDDIKGFERLSILGKLEVLNLDGNSLNNNILPSLALLSSLKTLNLGSNYLSGSIDIGEFCNMSNLEELDLSYNGISPNRIDNIKGFERLSVLGKLEVLNLDDNSLNNNILPSLAVLSSLKTLNLGSNYLSGSIDIGEFCNMSNLEELDLSYNGIYHKNDIYHNNGIDDIKGFERLFVLGKLEVLNLDGNSLNNSILPSLAVLSSLKILNLGSNYLSGSIDIGEFCNMSNFEELDLSFNYIDDIKGFERSSVLGKLEVLNLKMNLFNNSILPSLAMLSSVKTLYLSWNKLNGSIDIGEFHNMSNLEELHLSYNHHIEDIKGLKSLSKLQILDLSNNNVNASILQSAPLSLKTLNLRWNGLKGLVRSTGLDGLKHLHDLYLDYSSIDKSFLYNIGVMSSLRVLTLRGIGFNGSLPDQGWCKLSNLQELDFSENGFEGMLPSCLGDLTSIRLLDLSFNQFAGNIALSPLTKLTTLEYLILSNNHFEIPISFVSFFNHSKLKVLSGDNNRLSDQIEFQTWTPKFQLQAFSLSNYGSNKLGMKLPHFLFYQYDLRLLDLSHILVGKFPVWLLENNTRLEILSLRNGHLTGPFLLPSYPNPHAISIDISDNQIEGPIPINIGFIFPNLLIFNVSKNRFQGYIPTSLGDMQSLENLDLSNNNLSGQIPEHLAIGCSSLFFLKLSNNNLSGQLSPSFVNLTNLEYLYLDNNHFEGKIPDSMSIPPYLRAIDIGNNDMHGKLPRWMGNMSFLIGITMFSNHFEGPIPVELCKLGDLEFLDLSKNNLTGSIPSCFNQSAIRHVHLNQNKLSGPMTCAFYNSSSLVTLDLSDNNLSGTIPSWIGSLSELSILLLKFNNFEGEIPVQLCQLKQLTILDLSENNLFGHIPHCFIDIPFETTRTKSSLQTYLLPFSLQLLPNFMEGTQSLENHYVLNYGELKNVVVKQEVKFTTKHGSYVYKGNILNYMSGVDLSCNYLTGEIPPEIGKLSNIQALNLSYNNLTGSIPTTFSYLRQIESLDLSYNNLSGRIPSQLIELKNLEVFSVAHNNLSGATPDRKAQFATFEESSYEGNSLLCGIPLQNNCSEPLPTSTMSKALDKKVEDGGFIDMGVFYLSFLGSYVTVLLGIAAVLLINPHWRRAWFHIIEVCMISGYYFVLDNFMNLWNNRSV